MAKLKRGETGPFVGFVTQVNVDIPAVGVAAVATVANIAVPGAEVGDAVFATPAAALSVAVGICHCFVAAAGLVSMTVVNPTAGALDPAALNINFTVLKSALLRND